MLICEYCGEEVSKKPCRCVREFTRNKKPIRIEKDFEFLVGALMLIALSAIVFCVFLAVMGDF